ncbi:MAG: cytochrome c biogenesis protein CcsA [Verrucomicrobiae bacterium]|nr:cytochrome c biogenesis protein CcsA [Verrucomicrobiae bacterium]
MKKWLPWILTVVMAGWALSTLRPSKQTGFKTDEFAKLPVLMNGRFQPFDSVARNSLLQIRARQTVPVEENGRSRKLPARDWLVEVLMKPEQADDRKIFRIDNVELISLLKLTEEQKYYTFTEIRPQYDEIGRQAERIQKIEAANRTPFERELMKLYSATALYQRLKLSLKPPNTDDFAAEVSAYETSIAPGVAAVRAREAGKEFDKAAFDRLLRFMSGYDSVARFALPLTIPSPHPEEGREKWLNMGQGLLDGLHHQHGLPPAATYYATMVSAYRQNDPASFNRAVEEYRGWLAKDFAPELRKANHEFFFNHAQVFLDAMVLYVFALILALGSLLTFGMFANLSEALRRSAYWIIVVGCIIHTIGLVYRMVLEGRPPVTNLYSSAIFIGWAAVILGLFLERIYRIGIGSVVAACVGFITLIIAHNLAVGGDTMEMMRAVLDTNFWLATHVVTITLGYSAMFVAGLLAILFIVLGVFTPMLSKKLTAGDPAKAAPAEAGKSEVGVVLTKMVYGIICFATLFSFVGTVLGGIWADQSWGRFWGWDPKENGALMIVIWCAVILHARWGKIIKERGLMVLAIIGNMVTAFSWFGVNMLGIGLHSYGFMDAAFKWLMIFNATQVCFIILGFLPLRVWKSYPGIAPASPSPSGPAGGKAAPAPAGA